ncbi:uncharacterized protein LOC106770548 [Vigna radiata var. radiata]|uniref:Uncharacterized protein LOC106770548 n=1 Tax=Vigna radiata var. radiata TaxID=3916 RepID=A0A1S3V0G9_VIGRR|nr:uncharacterized protein LOC106770548 [Vigna radiata var. radiata]
MPQKRFQEPQPKTGVQHAQDFLRKIGFGKENYYFWKQIGKALVCMYTVMGSMWWYNETSPLGWWTLKPKPKEEKELAHLCFLFILARDL